MSLPHALLGLLVNRPMTGYELNQMFNDSINFFYSAQMSQIYRELKSLEQKGYVTFHEESSSKGPRKKVYSVTDQGVEHLKEWLMTEPERIDEDNRNVFLLRVMLLESLGYEELYRFIEKRLQKYREDLQALQAVHAQLESYSEQSQSEKSRIVWEITLSRGYHDVKSHIDWAEISLQLLEKHIKKDKNEE